MKKYIFGFVVVIILAGAFMIVRSSQNMPVQNVGDKKGTYVALGDSVAAGAGLGEASDSSACERSKLGYPNLVASDEKYTLKNVTCGGATIPVGITGAQTVNNLAQTPQLDELFKEENPSLATITIGANDIQWIEAMVRCIQQECNTSANDAFVANNISALKLSLGSLLTQIKSHYKDDTPQLVIVGYYQPVSEDGACSENGDVQKDERQWIIKQTNALNDALKQTADESGYAKFALPDFSGHELCSEDSYVQGILDKSGYHPTKDGEKAMADAVRKVINK